MIQRVAVLACCGLAGCPSNETPGSTGGSSGGAASPEIGDTSSGDLPGGTSTGDGTGTDAAEGSTSSQEDACPPVAPSCEELGGSCVGGSATRHSWTVTGQSSSGSCTTTFGSDLVFDCGDAELTLALDASTALEFAWSEGDTVDVAWSSQDIVGGSDSTVTVHTATGELLLAAVHLDWSAPESVDEFAWKVLWIRLKQSTLRGNIPLDDPEDSQKRAAPVLGSNGRRRVCAGL